jgi:hypothetical protein
LDIRLLDSAKDDLRNGWLFYERQIPGLGDRFLAAIEADVRALSIYGGILDCRRGPSWIRDRLDSARPMT